MRNNYIINAFNNNKYSYTAEDLQLARDMFIAIRAIYSGAREPDFHKWANDIRLIRERDDRTLADVRMLFDFANQHDFWCRNILSPAKLRKHWDRLMIERDHGPQSKSQAKRHATQSAVDKVRAANAARLASAKVIEHD
jgi:hypothetical protein